MPVVDNQKPQFSGGAIGCLVFAIAFFSFIVFTAGKSTPPAATATPEIQEAPTPAPSAQMTASKIKPVFNIMNIYGEKQRRISKILGEPAETWPPEPGGRDQDTIRIYKPKDVSEVSIEFDNSGIAEDVQVVLSQSYPTPQDALARVGAKIGHRSADVEAPAGVWWLHSFNGVAVNRIGAENSKTPQPGWDTVQVQRHEVPGQH